MNNKKMMYVICALCALLLTSACSTESDKGANNGSTTDTVTTQPSEPSDNIETKPSEPNEPTEPTKQTEPTEPIKQSEPVKSTKPTESKQENAKPQKDNSAESDKKILVIIDQTPKPIEGNSFDFGVKQIPEGYSLAELQWISKDNTIINSIQEAIENGANGGDGFYISGNGQYTGFFYPDSMKGEEGQVVFLFKNDQGKELTWKKKITLI